MKKKNTLYLCVMVMCTACAPSMPLGTMPAPDVGREYKPVFTHEPYVSVPFEEQPDGAIVLCIDNATWRFRTVKSESGVQGFESWEQTDGVILNPHRLITGRAYDVPAFPRTPLRCWIPKNAPIGTRFNVVHTEYTLVVIKTREHLEYRLPNGDAIAGFHPSTPITHIALRDAGVPTDVLAVIE